MSYQRLSFLSSAALSRSRVLLSKELLLVLAFLFVGPALIMTNKHIMENLLFPYPLSIAAVGLLSSAACSHFLVRLNLATIRHEAQSLTSGKGWFKTVLPIGLCTALMHATGNAVYLFMGLGFIQMLKAFAPAVIMVVAYIGGVQVPSIVELAFVLLIVAGTLFEVKGDVHTSAIGLVMMLMSELFEGVSLVLSQKMFAACKLNVVEVLYFISPVAFLFLGFLVTVIELPRMVQSLDHNRLVNIMPDVALAAVLGASVNLVSFAVLRATSAVTVKVLNIMRGIGVIIVSVLFYGEICTGTEVVGYCVTVIGFCGYTYVQVNPEQSSRVERWARSWARSAHKRKISNAPVVT